LALLALSSGFPIREMSGKFQPLVVSCLFSWLTSRVFGSSPFAVLSRPLRGVEILSSLPPPQRLTGGSERTMSFFDLHFLGYVFDSFDPAPLFTRRPLVPYFSPIMSPVGSRLPSVYDYRPWAPGEFRAMSFPCPFFPYRFSGESLRFRNAFQRRILSLLNTFNPFFLYRTLAVPPWSISPLNSRVQETPPPSLHPPRFRVDAFFPARRSTCRGAFHSLFLSGCKSPFSVPFSAPIFPDPLPSSPLNSLVSGGQ